MSCISVFMSCISVSITKSDLCRLYNKEKLTTYKIADIYNCCQATVWKRLHQFDIEPRIYRVDLSKNKLIDLYVKDKLSTWQIESKYGYGRGTVYRKLCEYGIITRNIAASHIIYKRKNFDGSLADKSYMIGFAMGDLRVRKVGVRSETIKIGCGSTKKEQIDLIYKLFKPYGRVWVSKTSKTGITNMECFLDNSFNFLLKKRILMDQWILKNKEYFLAFLAGFTDAEGCISISKLNQAFYSLGNYNFRLLKQIRNQLIKFGIKCAKLTEGKTKGRRFGKNSHIHNQNYWHFSIHRKLSLLSFFDVISPYLKHQKRLNDMERAKQNIKLRNKKYGNINMNS